MGEHHFIHQNSHGHKIKALIVSASSIILMIAIILLVSYYWYYITKTFPFIQITMTSVQRSIIDTTSLGMFYAHFIGGIFFVPSPEEAIFYYGLVKSQTVILPLIFSLMGYLLAQVLNYYLGSKISSFTLNFISKKKVYKTRRFVNKYGIYGIFLFNFLPFPSPLLTFALGIAKYRFSRMFISTSLGVLCKYLVLIGAYLWFSA